MFAEKLPANESHDLLVDTLYKSWEIYEKPKWEREDSPSFIGLFDFSAIILFVIPEREFNIGDQMLIERGLLSHSKSSLLIKHVTFIDICQQCSLDCNGALYL